MTAPAPDPAVALIEVAENWLATAPDDAAPHPVYRLVRDLIALLQQIRRERDELQTRMDDVLLKDRGKTREINILTNEVRDTLAAKDAALRQLKEVAEFDPYEMEGPFKQCFFCCQPDPAPHSDDCPWKKSRELLGLAADEP